MIDSKTCPKCNSLKLFSDYSKNKSNTDGMQTYCKSCIKIVNKLYLPSEQAKVNKKTRSALWKKENKNLTREYDRKLLNKWRKENPSRASAHSIARRASKINATPPWLTQEDKLKIIEMCELRDKLENLTGVVHHIDHIVPLQGENVCGLHVPWNLQVITAEENCSKNNKLLEDLWIDLSAPFYN